MEVAPTRLHGPTTAVFGVVLPAVPEASWMTAELGAVEVARATVKVPARGRLGAAITADRDEAGTGLGETDAACAPSTTGPSGGFGRFALTALALGLAFAD
jgi:hypothetical protein